MKISNSHILSAGIAATLLLALLCACDSRGGSSEKAARANVEAVMASDSLPQPVKTVVKAVADRDTALLAHAISYPIERPYPLKNIDTPQQFEQNYNKIIDDSLRNVIINTPPEQWTDFGWLGWSIGKGEYFFIDENLYAIPYVSVAEEAERDSLVNEEMASLHKSLRGDWEPVGCLLGVSDGKVYRIDAHRHHAHHRSHGKNMRLLVYRNQERLDTLPDEEMAGYEDAEGTELNRTYIFSDSRGDKALYTPDLTDDTAPVIIYTDSLGQETNIEVAPVYWLDLRNHRR